MQMTILLSIRFFSGVFRKGLYLSSLLFYIGVFFAKAQTKKQINTNSECKKFQRDQNKI